MALVRDVLVKTWYLRFRLKAGGHGYEQEGRQEVVLASPYLLLTIIKTGKLILKPSKQQLVLGL
jgi:hypothetical protein